MTVAYALRDSNSHERLKAGTCSTTLKVDISFREPVSAIELVRLESRTRLHTYSLVDLVSEKLRAILQQASRNRTRRQDVYDIGLLVGSQLLDYATQQAILDVLRQKALSRGIEPTQDALSDPATKQRSEHNWQTLAQEVATLPPFETAYANVAVLPCLALVSDREERWTP